MSLTTKTKKNTTTQTLSVYFVNPFNEVAKTFAQLLKEAYSVYFIAPAIKESMNDFIKKEFESMEELNSDIAKLLFRIFYSDGSYKVYDYNNKNYYNDINCQRLFDRGIYIPEEWLHQLVKCIVVQSPDEDLKLHKLTPDWMWDKCFRLLSEMYLLTKQTILSNG